MVSIALVDARNTSFTGVQNSQKKSARRYAARGRCSASSFGQTPPPWKKARSAPDKKQPPLKKNVDNATPYKTCRIWRFVYNANFLLSHVSGTSKVRWIRNNPLLRKTSTAPYGILTIILIVVKWYP